MRRRQPFFSDYLFTGFAPLQIASAKEAVELGNQGVVAFADVTVPAILVARYRTKRLDCLAAMRVKAIDQPFGRSDQATRAGGALPVGLVEDPDKSVTLAIFDPLDTSSDVRPIRAIQSTMNSTARNAVPVTVLARKRTCQCARLFNPGKYFSQMS